MPNPKNIQRCACSKTIQRQSVNAANMDAVPSSVHEVLRSPGQPLDEETRFYMEPRFGHDFGRVRIHADSQAGESARAINALAYTVGNDVVFGAGRYKSATANGQRLLAHELAHVVQQRTSPITLIQRQLTEEVGTSLEDEQVTMERAEEVAWSRKSEAMNEQDMLGERQRFLLMNFAIANSKLKTSHEEYILMTVFFGNLSLDPLSKIEIIGHADTTGSSEFNEKLANKRAREVEKKLIQCGMSSDRIEVVKGEGYSQPIADNNTVIGRARNRRVEILVTPWKPAKPVFNLIAELSKEITPGIVSISNFADAPQQATIKQIVEDAFSPITFIRFDWTGTLGGDEAIISFDNTSKETDILGDITTVYLLGFKEDKICRVEEDPSTCEKTFPDTPEMMGRALANAVCHEIGHQFGLDHVTATNNYMWTTAVHPLYVKEAPTFEENILLHRTLNCAHAKFNNSQIMQMVYRIKEKQEMKRMHPNLIEF